MIASVVCGCSSFSNDQRPAVVRDGRLPEASVAAALRRGSISARNWSKPSAAASPAVASSHRARASLGAGQAGDALQIVREAGAALLEQCADAQGIGRERRRQERLVYGLLCERVRKPLGGLTDVERNRCGIGGNHAPRTGCAISVRLALREPCGMRRDASPANRSRETELVEPAWIVVGHARRQQRAFPLNRRCLKSFELTQGCQNAVFSGQLGLRRKMLPAQKPAHVHSRSNGLDLLARSRQGEPVDALQKASLAPFDMVIVLRGRTFERSAHQQALHFHCQKGLKDGGRAESKKLCEHAGSGWSENL